MMKILLFAISQVIAMAATGQQVTPSSATALNDYLKKSGNQRTVALALLIGGGAVLSAGIIWGISETNANTYYSSTLEGSGALVLIGMTSMLGSIPLFIAARRNARKAKAVTAQFKFEKGPAIQGGGMAYQAIPGLCLKWGL